MAAAQSGAHVLTTTLDVKPKLDDDLELVLCTNHTALLFPATGAACRCSWTHAGVELETELYHDVVLYIIYIIHSC